MNLIPVGSTIELRPFPQLLTSCPPTPGFHRPQKSPLKKITDGRGRGRKYFVRNTVYELPAPPTIVL